MQRRNNGLTESPFFLVIITLLVIKTNSIHKVNAQSNTALHLSIPLKIPRIMDVPPLLSSLPLPQVACAFLTALASIIYLLRRSSYSSLSNSYAPFKVLTRRIVHDGPRPIIALTLGVATDSLPTGSHVKIRVGGEGGPERSYTPIRFNGGVCELMIRVYPDGELTPRLHFVREGDMVEMKGPTGIHRYGEWGAGTFKNGRKAIEGVRRIGMISGGTGVTPMMQVINHIRADSGDGTEACLLSFNTGEGEIMMESELREIDDGDENISVKFLCSQGNVGRKGVEKGSMRNMTGEKLMEAMGLEGGGRTDELVMICGPKGFVTKAKGELEGLVGGGVLVW